MQIFTKERGGFTGDDSQQNQVSPTPIPKPTPKPTTQPPKYFPSPATKTKTTEKPEFVKTTPTFDYKTNTLKLQTDVNSKIKSIKSGVYKAQEALHSTHFKNAEAKKEFEKAWTSLWWAKKYFGDAEWTQKEGEYFISKSNFKDGYYKYKYSLDSANKINKYLFEITDYFNKAKKLEK